MVRSAGFTQTDHHGGNAGFFRFGDFELNREKWPQGWESFKRVVGKLHDAGIGSIFHTYAFFIDKQSKYVTPRPDPRLDAFRTFTLAEPLTEDAREMVVNEPTTEMRTTTGFIEQNSIVLHLGDELVTFGGASKQAPWTFTGLKRAVDILKTCEDLRHANAFDEAAKAKLREPNSEFALCRDAAGKSRFRRVKSTAQIVSLSEPWSWQWRAANGFEAQPARFRIEALMAAQPDDTNAVTLADLGNTEIEAWKRTAAAGVSFTSSPQANPGSGQCLLVATNSGQVPRHGAWIQLRRQFDPPLNLKEQPGIAVEVEGDGSGCLVAIRLESPHHLAYGGIADRYIMVDFVGRRNFTLVETESTRWSDYDWNDQKTRYNAYRETIHFDVIESVSVWLQNLPSGRTARVGIGRIRAVPLHLASVVNPTITVAGHTIEFPVKLGAGCWIEANGPEECTVYGTKGESLGIVTPRGDWPTLNAGENVLRFSGQPEGAVQPRARVVTVVNGEVL